MSDQTMAAAADCIKPTGNPPRPGGGAWHIAFADGFGEKGLDTHKWSSGLAWASNGVSYGAHHDEAQFYTPHGIDVPGDGKCHLVAHKQSYSAFGATKQWQSGAINTCGKWSFAKVKPTLLEGRFCFHNAKNNGAGLWPAFWLLQGTPGHYPWPPEIDIFETFGDFTPVGHIHTTGGDLGTGYNFGGNHLENDRMHTIGTMVSPLALDFYFDGKKVSSETNRDHISRATGDPMYLILELALGSYGGDASKVGDGTELQIDWIRAWQ